MNDVTHERSAPARIQGGGHPAAASRRGGQSHRPRQVRRRSLHGEHAGGQGAAQPTRARAHQVDRHLESPGLAGREGGDHRRRFQRSALGVHSGRRDDGELPRHDAQYHGAREGALRRPRGRGGGGDHRGGGRAGARAHRRRLRSAAACDRRGGSDGSRRTLAARQHVHHRRGSQAGATLQRRQARRVQSRRHRGRLREGGRRRRARVHHRTRASGLHRTARVPRERVGGWSGGAVVHDARAVHRAQLLREAARHGARKAARDRLRDRRRLRRQDRGLPRAARARAVAQVGAAGEDGHVAHRSVPVRPARPPARRSG